MDGTGEGASDALRTAIARVREEAEHAVRSGKSQLFLTDEHVGADRMGITMILAAAGVHTHLVRKGLRSYASINVRSAECLDTHYFAVLIGVGTTTVNAYLAQEAIAARHAKGLFRRPEPVGVRRALQDRRRWRLAEDHVEDGHLHHLVLPGRL